MPKTAQSLLWLVQNVLAWILFSSWSKLCKGIYGMLCFVVTNPIWSKCWNWISRRCDTSEKSMFPAITAAFHDILISRQLLSHHKLTIQIRAISQRSCVISIGWHNTYNLDLISHTDLWSCQTAPQQKYVCDIYNSFHLLGLFRAFLMSFPFPLSLFVLN